jgi:hypothetical protein
VEVLHFKNAKRSSIATIIYTMELESDTYDVVVIGTGLAESIAAAQVMIPDV